MSRQCKYERSERRRNHNGQRERLNEREGSFRFAFPTSAFARNKNGGGGNPRELFGGLANVRLSVCLCAAGVGIRDRVIESSLGEGRLNSTSDTTSYYRYSLHCSSLWRSTCTWNVAVALPLMVPGRLPYRMCYNTKTGECAQVRLIHRSIILRRVSHSDMRAS